LSLNLHQRKRIKKGEKCEECGTCGYMGDVNKVLALIPEEKRILGRSRC
jgi:hypothetical protein